jgi:lysophospholipase L1-like esterase
MLPLGRDVHWLFAGDSITDCGRRDDPDGLGDGYVRMIRDRLLARDPASAPRITNRGVGGDTIRDLAARFEEDVVAQQPDVVSIKIGINDVWRTFGTHPWDAVPLPEFLETYERLLDRLADALPAAKVVLCEPSVISPPQDAEANLRVLPYAMAVAELATRRANQVAFGVPLHKTCLEAEAARPDVDWWTDGVHPTSAGHALLAETWLASASQIERKPVDDQ